jgi:hypothetical protein
VADVQVKPRCKCKGCSFWLVLEAERADLSYKRPSSITPPPKEEKPRTITKVVYRDTPLSEERDLMMFNAGRHAAGARDQPAINAAAMLNVEMEKARG